MDEDDGTVAQPGPEENEQPAKPPKRNKLRDHGYNPPKVYSDCGRRVWRKPPERDQDSEDD